MQSVLNTAIPFVTLFLAINAGGVIQSADAPVQRDDTPPGSESVEPSIVPEDKEPGGDAIVELSDPPQTQPNGKRFEEVLDEATAAKILEKLPSAEELRKSLADKYDLSELGGESPRAVATAITKGTIEGDVEKVITAYDLTTKESVLVAMMHAVAARMAKSSRQLYDTVEKKFGEEGLKVLAELEEGGMQDQEFQDPWQKADVAVDDAIDSLEIYYREDRQKAIAKGQEGEPIEMHQRNGRWYASASTKDAAKSTMMYQWMLLPVAAFERQIEIAEKAKTVEQLRQELKTEKETPLLDAIEADKNSGDGADAGDNTVDPFGVDVETGKTIQAVPGVTKQEATGGDRRQALIQQELIEAAKRGDIPAIKAQLRKGADVNAPDKRAGKPPLMWAAKNADAEAVHFLIDSGADVNMRSESGRTALYMAMSNPKHRVEIVRTLLASGGSPNTQQNPEGGWLSVFGRALSTGAEREIFELLLEAGLTPNSPDHSSWHPLRKAAASGRADVVELLLDRGAVIDAQHRVEKTALMYAASSEGVHQADPIRTLRLLVDAGADMQVNYADREGMTALHYAAETGDLLSSSKIALLLQVGARVDSRNNQGRTPLMLAALNSPDAGPVEALLRSGADPNTRDHHEFTPLHWAIHWGQRPPNHFTIYRLLEKRAEVNRASDAGWTPLMLACRRSDSKILALLLSRGADPNLRNDDGWTALLIALANNKREIWSRWLREEKWFVQPGRPMSEEDADFLAATLIGDGPAYGQVGLVWILLTHGANSDVKAKDGTTVHTLLNGRDDTSATAVRKLLEIDVREDVRQHKNGNDREP